MCSGLSGFLLFLITGDFLRVLLPFLMHARHFCIKQLRTLSKIPGCVLTFSQALYIFCCNLFISLIAEE